MARRCPTTHLVCDGRGRALAFVLTPGQAADASMLVDTLGQIRVAGSVGRPLLRLGRVIADKGYPSRANRAWLRRHGIAATIPERDDQIAHCRKKPGRPIDFGDEQRQRYRGRNVVERCFNRLKHGAASRCGQIRPPATTTPDSASRPPSNGFSNTP
jgi:transposase